MRIFHFAPRTWRIVSNRDATFLSVSVVQQAFDMQLLHMLSVLPYCVILVLNHSLLCRTLQPNWYYKVVKG